MSTDAAASPSPAEILEQLERLYTAMRESKGATTEQKLLAEELADVIRRYAGTSALP
jgi:hypothetical protein